MIYRRNRLTGWLLVITAALGVFVSLAGLILTWTVGPRVKTQVLNSVSLASQAADTSNRALIVLSTSLSNIGDTLVLMKNTSDQIASSMDQTVPMIDSTSVLVGDNIASLVRNTQSSLSSAQSSARLVDDTLRLITSLPLIGQRYAPSQSLSSSITQINSSLDGLPEALAKLKTNLQTTSANVRESQTKVVTLSSDLQRMSTDVQDAEQVVSQYQQQVSDLQSTLGGLSHSLATWLTIGQIGLTFFFIWLGLAQISIINQGMAMIHGVEIKDLRLIEE